MEGGIENENINSAILIFSSGFVNADYIRTKITQVGAAAPEYGMLVVETPTPTKPECAQQNTIMSFDKTTAHGKDLYAIALMGFATQKDLAITYSNSKCGLWGVRMLIIRIDVLRD